MPSSTFFIGELILSTNSNIHCVTLLDICCFIQKLFYTFATKYIAAMKPTFFEIILMIILGIISIPLVIYSVVAAFGLSYALFMALFIEPFRKSPK
jgi:hypothetical protein